MEPTTPLDPEPSGYDGNGSGIAAPRAAGLGEKAAAAIDAKRPTVARGIDAAAAALQAKAESLAAGDRVARAARNTAYAMERAAGYVREQDVRAMLFDLRQSANRHPGAVLLAAAALGFMLARALSRR